MNTIREALSSAGGILVDRLDAEVLLAFVLKKTREFLIAHPEVALTQEQDSTFRECMSRRAFGVPLSYITNHKEFFGIPLYVDERCLIPRPETELLVETAIELYRSAVFKRKTIVDVGTGSGAIAVALAQNIPSAIVLATDISDSALKVARINIYRHGLEDRITLKKSHLLENVGEVDIIVANLPYIGEQKFNFVEEDVKKHEPAVALFGGENGLKLYEELFAQVNVRQNPPRYLIGEFGFSQRKVLEEMLNNFFVRNMHLSLSGKPKMTFKKDGAGLDRIFLVDFC